MSLSRKIEQSRSKMGSPSVDEMEALDAKQRRQLKCEDENNNEVANGQLCCVNLCNGRKNRLSKFLCF